MKKTPLIPFSPFMARLNAPVLLLCALAISVVIVALPSLASASVITLAWEAPTTKVDGSPLGDLAGFKLYYGTLPGNYSATLDAGAATTYQMTDLEPGATYYFAVTAYDASGNESDFSNEVAVTTSVSGPGARIGVFRGGTWYLDMDGNDSWDGQPADAKFAFGRAGDVSVVGDWDGTGIHRAGVFRDGYWYLDINGNGAWDGQPADARFKFGRAGDIPVTGDWDGIGIHRAGVFRDGYWYLDINGNGAWDGQPADARLKFGRAGDVPVVGDWNADGATDISVFRGGWWYLDLDGDHAWDGSVDLSARFGTSGDIPVSGTW
ncbi:MAG: hypothetical protein Kow0025_08450 [Thermodesulfovibrionales bacterium]